MAGGKGRSSNQGVKLLYIRDYLHKHTNKEHPKNAKEISKYLASKGIKAERKTIYNDILRLQVDFQEPIEYHPNKKGYYISEPTFSFYELQVLMESVRTSNILSSQEVESMCRRIADLTNIYDSEELTAITSLGNEPVRSTVSELEKVTLIQQAIRENRKIKFRQFTYYPTDDNRATNGKCYVNSYSGNEVHIVSPYMVVRAEGKYFLACFRNDARMKSDRDYIYCLDTIEDLEIIPSERECFKLKIQEDEKLVPLFDSAAEIFLDDGFMDGMLDGDEEFNEENEAKYDWIRDMLMAYEDYWPNFFFKTKKEIPITLRFKKQDAWRILKKFGQDTVLVPGERDYCTATPRIPLTRNLFEWLFTMRYEVWIDGPPSAAQLYTDYVENILKYYRYIHASHGELLTKFLPVLQEKVEDEQLQKRLGDYEVSSFQFSSIRELLMRVSENGSRTITDEELTKLANSLGASKEQLLGQLAQEYISYTKDEKEEFEQAMTDSNEMLLGELEPFIEKLVEVIMPVHTEHVEDLLQQLAQDNGISVEQILAELGQQFEVDPEDVIDLLASILFTEDEDTKEQMYSMLAMIAVNLNEQNCDEQDISVEELLEGIAEPLGISTEELILQLRRKLRVNTERLLEMLENGTPEEFIRITKALRDIEKKDSKI